MCDALHHAVQGAAALLAEAVLTHIPEVVVLCGAWFGAGVLSCVLFGCGAMNMLVFLLPYVNAAEQEAATLAIIFYGLGSVVGEYPGYLLSKEKFSAARLQLQGKRHPSKYMTALYAVVSDTSSWQSYCTLIMVSACSPFVDVAGHICGAFGLSHADYFLPTMVGKGVIKFALAQQVYTRCPWFRQFEVNHEDIPNGVPEVCFWVSQKSYFGGVEPCQHEAELCLCIALFCFVFCLDTN